MSLFRVFVDDQLFYHPHLSQLSITEAKVQEDAENIDSLTLSAPFNHPYLSSIQPMASTIVCKKDDLTVFEGRALDDGTDFYNTHTWTCESCLAYLKDTMQPPFSYQGPLRGLLEQFLSVHNAAVEEKKQFTLGTVTVTDNNDYISYSNSDYSVTMDAIQDKLVKTHGGYLQVRYTENGKVLDYLEDFPDRSLQTVEFGKNLTDVKITRDHTERVTALIPLGAKLTETDEEGNETETDTRLDITAVNDGKNYVYDEEAVKEFQKVLILRVDLDDRSLGGCDTGGKPAAQSQGPDRRTGQRRHQHGTDHRGRVRYGCGYRGHPGKDVCPVYFQSTRD